MISACSPPRPRPCRTRQPIRVPTEWENPARIEPTVKIVIASCTSSFLLNRSASLPQIGVVAVEASRVAVTTHVYWLCVPCRSVMIVGRAFATIVDDRNAVNIASSIPESASRVRRRDMRPPSWAADRRATASWSGGVSSAVVVNPSPRADARAGARARVVRGSGGRPGRCPSGRPLVGGDRAVQVLDQLLQPCHEMGDLGVVPPLERLGHPPGPHREVPLPGGEPFRGDGEQL